MVLKWFLLLAIVSGSNSWGMELAGACFAPESVTARSRLHYFHNTYDECRAQFQASAKRLTAKLPPAERGAVQTGKWKIPSATDQNLFTDWLFLPARKEPKHLIVVTSGTHGVEGFMGSAVQVYMMEELLAGFDRDTTGVLLVHAINPYGFKYKRRVTENNVDFNRNWDTDPALFKFKNSGYAKLAPLLNPTYPVRYDYISGIGFFADVANVLLHEKLAVVRTATLQGQYEYPKGIYYGGKEFEPHKDLYEQFMNEKAAPYGAVMHLDLHTGYGNKGQLHLFPTGVTDPATRTAMFKVFEGYPIDEGGSDDFYANQGDFTVYTMKRMLELGKKVVPMTLEYGTTDNLGTIGGVESLRLSVVENQLHFYGATTPVRARNVREAFLAQYYPQSEMWRMKTLSDTAKWLPIFMSRFSALK